MKKCPYCGGEYPDDATNCIIDTEVLVEHPPGPVVQGGPAPGPKPVSVEVEPYRPYPDYQWRARDAWKCMGIILCFTAIITGFEQFTFFFSPALYRSGHGYVFCGLIFNAASLLAVAYFARTETLKTFLRGLGLDQKPTELAWLGVATALIIRFTGHFMLVHHWGRGVHNPELTGFRNEAGFERWLYLIPLVIFAPLFGEAINRGFLYKACRGSYPVFGSVLLIIGWTYFTSSLEYLRSWIAATDISVLTIIQCYLREKSGSLWDCILCHFVFNVSLLFI